MYKTLRISFSLRNAYRVNGVLYSLKQIPIIKKLLPEKIYGVWGLKIFANIVSVIIEIISAFLGKFLYFYLMIFLPTFLITDVVGGNIVSSGQIFVHILFFLSIIGSYMNTFLFDPTRDKYYGIIIMRMNAKRYALVNYGYSLIKLIIGFLIFGLLFGKAYGVPLWISLITPLFVTGLKLTVAVYDLFKYEKTRNATNENKPGVIKWVIVFVLLGVAYALPLLNTYIPLNIAAYLMFIPIITGALSLRKICTFGYYREYYKQILQPEAYQKDLTRKVMNEYSKKLISADTSITSKRKGFEYMNELFVKRHHKVLWKPSRIVTFVLIGLILLAVLVLQVAPDSHAKINEGLLNYIPLLTIWVYSMNRGPNYTQALFMNCDHSLLSYSIYKQPKFVLKLFSIRLREIIKINLLPASVLGIGLSLLLFLSGGTDNYMNYLVLLTSIPAMSIFFSVHYLTMYYLLQPYNRDTEMKSGTLQIINLVVYFACFYIMYLEIPTMLFGAMTILFSLIYCIVACILVYKVGPKTFKLRM